MAPERLVCVVTGANRGLGLETVRQLAHAGHTIVLTSRDAEKGRARTDELQSEGLDVSHHPLDVTKSESVRELANALVGRFARLDSLVNNAGVFLEHRCATPASAAAGDLDLVRSTLETNLFGPMRVTQALLPLMRNRGCIVNVSSGLGQLQDMQGGWPGYRLSKAALNAYTRSLAAELADTQIKVNSVCPGWVRTEMGGPDADRTVAQGADTIVWAATLKPNGPSGGFFRDRESIPW